MALLDPDDPIKFQYGHVTLTGGVLRIEGGASIPWKWGRCDGWSGNSTDAAYIRFCAPSGQRPLYNGRDTLAYLLDDGKTIEVWDGSRYGDYYHKEPVLDCQMLASSDDKKIPRDNHGVPLPGITLTAGLLKA